MAKHYSKNSKTYKTGERIGFLLGLLVFCSIMFFIATKTGWIDYNITYSTFILLISILFIIYIIIKRIFK